MSSQTINILKDFSRYPLGRYKKENPFAGQAFRDRLLAPALNENDKVIVVLDGTAGYGSSFLEEAFGGLIRNGFDLATLKAKLEIISNNDASYIQEIWGYINDADALR